MRVETGLNWLKIRSSEDFRDKGDLTAELGVDDANGGRLAYFMTYVLVVVFIIT
jgi:hypothetical protein